MPWALRMVTYAAVLLLIFLTWFGYRYLKSLDRIELSHKMWLKALFFLAAALFLAYPVGGHLLYWIGGSFDRNGFPLPFIYLFWYGLVFTGVMLNWLIIHDITRPLAVRYVDRPAKEVNKSWAGAFLIMTLVTFIYTSGKMYADTGRMVLHEIEAGDYMEHSDTGADAEDLNVVHIADLHADIYTKRDKLSRYIDLVNRAEPDIVIVSGDLITSGLDFIREGARALGEINAPEGVFFVMGDHDYWTGTQHIESALVEEGIDVLQNENRTITFNGKEIKITGVTELYSYRVEPQLLDSLLAKEEGDYFHIVAAHQASERLIRRSQLSEADLLLTGHTHGGQINIPLFFMPLTAVMEETPYVRGAYQLERLLLNVNSGLGFTLSPVRYNAPASVSVLRIALP
ncbi:metallophosphoesterase [Rhodohalobacter mucosus]|uniref:Calcineurin-like phosphoesterase domain-containing protein n=1 Tax=Rhodohalobacter mucosus TaxID=2079485 RepID=A0A316TXN3_9BACT|nr:metallophosphoesterase [Rhodohalobacter mucosus]PWN07414.1 hypothetical protein DDZ15_03885 [Rhodohalobacter mucosus]